MSNEIFDDEELIKNVTKLAQGFEYEEIQTTIEETTSGTKKRITRVKKYVAPDINALKYLNHLKNKNKSIQELENELRYKTEDTNNEN